MLLTLAGLLILILLVFPSFSFSAKGGKPSCWSARFTVTAYSSSVAETDGSPFVTATGTRVHWGTLAVDPRVIPLWTQSGKKKNIFVPQYGWGTAEDTGSSIKGFRIDVWMPTRSKALAWGVKRLPVRVC